MLRPCHGPFPPRGELPVSSDDHAAAVMVGIVASNRPKPFKWCCAPATSSMASLGRARLVRGA